MPPAYMMGLHSSSERITVVTDSLRTVAFVMCFGHPPVLLAISKMMVLGLHFSEKTDFKYFLLNCPGRFSASLCRVSQCMIACGPVLQLPLPRERSAPTKESTGHCQNAVPRTQLQLQTNKSYSQLASSEKILSFTARTAGHDSLHIVCSFCYIYFPNAILSCISPLCSYQVYGMKTTLQF